MTASPMTSVVETITALQRRYPCSAGAGWDFDGFRVWVESNEPALIRALEDYFVDFRRLQDGAAALTRITAIETTPPDFAAGHELTIGEYKPSVRGPKEATLDLGDGRAVHKLRTGMWFLFGRDHHLAIGPCCDNPNQIVNFVNNRMIQWALHRGALLGHASAVARRPATTDAERPAPAIVIAGFSGMGKSTLALELMNDRRLDFLSNDRVMLHARAAQGQADAGRLIVEGVPKHPRINPGTILYNAALGPVFDAEQRRRFAALEADELWRLEHKFDGLIGACFPGQRFLLRAELAGVVLLNWTRGGGPTRPQRIDVDQRRELLPALMKAPGVFHQPGPGERPAEADDYVARLAGVPVLELAGGVDFDRGRHAALELLGL